MTAKQLSKLKLFTIGQAFGGWIQADEEHFADGGRFGQIQLKKQAQALSHTRSLPPARRWPSFTCTQQSAWIVAPK